MSAVRIALDAARVGYRRTFRFDYRKNGARVDLSGKSILAKVGTILVAGVPTDFITLPVSVPAQVGDDLSTFTAVLSAAQATSARAGLCWLDVLMGDSVGTEEPLSPRLSFAIEAKETEA